MLLSPLVTVVAYYPLPVDCCQFCCCLACCFCPRLLFLPQIVALCCEQLLLLFSPCQLIVAICVKASVLWLFLPLSPLVDCRCCCCRQLIVFLALVVTVTADSVVANTAITVCVSATCCYYVVTFASCCGWFCHHPLLLLFCRCWLIVAAGKLFPFMHYFWLLWSLSLLTALLLTQPSLLSAPLVVAVFPLLSIATTVLVAANLLLPLVLPPVDCFILDNIHLLFCVCNHP